MSNILVIKHGSLGDIAQASGAMQDISDNHKNDDLYLLTTKPYLDLFKKNSNFRDIILDKRLSRFNLIYLYLLMRKLKKYKFTKVYDLQNSNRTSFYKKILFPYSNSEIWSSTETTLPEGTSKKQFDRDGVLKRFEHQLKSSGINTKNVLKPDFSWSCENIEDLKNKFKLQKYIILFPFSSPHLIIKRWPYYNNLIEKIKSEYSNEFQIVVAPGPDEIKIANEFNAICVLDEGKAVNISKLSSLINESSFVISNDTGPAHITAHLNKKGLVLFGSHTTAEKVSIETEYFKAIHVSDLSKLPAENVFEKFRAAIS